MKLAVVSLLVAPQIVFGGLERYPSLVRADTGRAPRDSIRVTYLGVNGYQFEAGPDTLLVDPYFTRAGLMSVALGQSVQPNNNAISEALKRVRPRVDGILVTHGHFDHLLDVPRVMESTGARLFTGKTAIKMAIAAGAPANRCTAVRPGQSTRVGAFNIHILAAGHDRLFGKTPYPGPLSDRAAIPRKADDWVLGEPLAFLIEANGRRIYIEAGGRIDLLPDTRGKAVDLAILGTALPDSRKRFAAAVKRLKPRYLLPSHQDNFFVPFSRGFSFGPLTDFTFITDAHRRQKLPGELILLDYFRPWTIP